tara:strand:+ start:1173 stop:1463 length:291 start_codon:yes stop_codon:yes gene_type:complete
MRTLILTALLIVAANTVAAKTLAISHDKKLPTPNDLITKGTILNKTPISGGTMAYFIAWDKTDDFYWCVLRGTLDPQRNATVRCRLAIQETQSTVE